ncbi:XdhC family protein [Nocardiopsis sp. MG754419]|uniref:XdhC family protein n=1 Tax=Nocardiopsis sp. MG754419 TaxID=2259865 RepID=UPI001BAD54BB|nr:XdhC family protein [Nocardiopsis sp. MG754419]MBR8744844.1 carbon monoxide dehydrogenase accessory protein [Nocardiopsis sp. MG754419]
MAAVDLSGRGRELLAGRVPFVEATVVRAQVPASARPGDGAIVLPDGSIEGFVGGQCAQGSVRAAALEAIRDGHSVLLRVLPGEEEPFPETPGAHVVVNPCLSGGALEIFLRPRLPEPVVAVVGDSPIVAALREMAPPLGFVVESGPAAVVADATAVVVASHGGDEAAVIRTALDAGVGFVGLVASRRRGAAVLDSLDLGHRERGRVHTPVGLDIGAGNAAEIALSILAQLTREMRVNGLTAPVRARPDVTGAPRPDEAMAVVAGPGVGAPGEDAPAGGVPGGGAIGGGNPPVATAVDPVCGMTVTVGPTTPHLEVGGKTRWFCCTGCRDREAARG